MNTMRIILVLLLFTTMVLSQECATNEDQCCESSLTDVLFDSAAETWDTAFAAGEVTLTTYVADMTEGSIRNIRQQDGTWATITTTASEAASAASMALSGALGAANTATQTFNIPNFCYVQNIGGTDVYIEGEVTAHRATRTIDGSLALLNTFDIGNAFHVSGAIMSVEGMSVSSTSMNTFSISADFCMGNTEHCSTSDTNIESAKRVIKGEATMTHTASTDSIQGSIPAFTVGGFCYPIIAAALDNNHAETFLTFLGSLANAGIVDANFGMERAEGKVRPIVSGTPTFGTLTPVTETEPVDETDVCSMSSFSPIECALRHFNGVDVTVDVSSTTTINLIAESPETSSTADETSISLVMKRETDAGDYEISITWAGGSVTGQGKYFCSSFHEEPFPHAKMNILRCSFVSYTIYFSLFVSFSSSFIHYLFLFVCLFFFVFYTLIYFSLFVSFSSSFIHLYTLRVLSRFAHSLQLPLTAN